MIQRIYRPIVLTFDKYFLLFICSLDVVNNAMLIENDHRLQVYGWSLPSNNDSLKSKATQQDPTRVQVPMPVHCQSILTSNEQTQVDN
jgi:hypothetical protein